MSDGALIDRDYRFDETVDSDWRVATDPKLGAFPSGYNRFEVVNNTDKIGPYTVTYQKFRVLARNGDGTLRWHDVYGVWPGAGFDDKYGSKTRGNVEKAVAATNKRNRLKMEQFRLAQSKSAEALKTGEAAQLGALDLIVADAVAGKEREQAEAAAASKAREAARKKDRLRRINAKLSATGRSPAAAFAATLAVAAEDATGSEVAPEQVAELAEAAAAGQLDQDVIDELFPLPKDPREVADAINDASPMIYNFFWQLKLAGVI